MRRVLPACLSPVPVHAAASVRPGAESLQSASRNCGLANNQMLPVLPAVLFTVMDV